MADRIPRGDRRAFETTLAAALERGARERERYEFLATVGHELRTPLTSIRGYIETLLDSDVDVDISRRFLETARREALRLTRLVDGVLDFSMLDLDVSTPRGVTDPGPRSSLRSRCSCRSHAIPVSN